MVGDPSLWTENGDYGVEFIVLKSKSLPEDMYLRVPTIIGFVLRPPLLFAIGCLLNDQCTSRRVMLEGSDHNVNC